MPNSSSYKGQFLLLTVVAIVSLLYLFSLWARPSDVLDLSVLLIQDEYFFMDNIGDILDELEKINDCRVLNYSIQEVDKTIREYAKERNWKVTLNYDFTSCSQPNITFFVLLQSPLRNITLNKTIVNSAAG